MTLLHDRGCIIVFKKRKFFADLIISSQYPNAKKI